MSASAGPAPAAAGTARGSGTAWLDLARVLAIVAVVTVHVAVPVYGAADPGTGPWWVGASLNAAARWCVPVFVMVSGALLLQPSRDRGVGGFYRKRLRRIGVPLVFWTCFYLGYRVVVLGEDLGPARVVELVGSGRPYLQLYFLYVVAGLALLTPFLRLVTRHAGRSGVAALAAVATGIALGNQALMSFVPVGGTNAVTLWVPYLGYYLLGWLLRDTLLRGRGVAVAALAFAGSVLGVLVWARLGTDYAFAYPTPLVLVMSVTAFLLLHRLGAGLRDGRSAGRPTWPRRLSDLSFGVFLVHPVFLELLRGTTGLPEPVGQLLAALAVQLTGAIAASLLVAAVARRLPVVREVF